jgi:Recombination endonuclease VII
MRKRIDQRARELARYKLTLCDYAHLLAQQGGVCAICGLPETRTRNGTVDQLSVDHDHQTGHVRGLLCNRCNRVLGLLSDDAAVLQLVKLYLAQ